MRLAARQLLVPVLLGLLILSGSALAAQQAWVTLSDYLSRLSQARSDAIFGLSTPSPAQMVRVRADLGLPTDVQVATRLVHVDQDPLLKRLSGDRPEDFATALQRINALAAQAEAAVDSAFPSPSVMRRDLDQAYRDIGSARPGLVKRIQRVASDVLLWLVESLSHLRGASTAVAWVVVLLLLLPLVPLTRQLRLVPDRAAPGGDPGGVSAMDWRRLADEALARGDLRAAVQALYSNLLSTLAASGLLANSTAVTAGECRWAVTRHRPEVAPVVADATSAFERVTYGQQEPTPADVDSLRRANRALFH